MTIYEEHKIGYKNPNFEISMNYSKCLKILQPRW